jgi:hypothetical protein
MYRPLGTLSGTQPSFRVVIAVAEALHPARPQGDAEEEGYVVIEAADGEPPSPSPRASVLILSS